MSEIYSEILSTIVTKSELQDFASELDRFIDSLFDTKETIEQNLKRHISYDKREKLLTLCREQKIDMSDISMLKDLMLKLKEQLRALPILELTLSFDPDREFLDNVSVWFLRNSGKKVILEINVDSKIIGGVLISYKGKFKDLSIKGLIDGKIERNELNFNH